MGGLYVSQASNPTFDNIRRAESNACNAGRGNRQDIIWYANPIDPIKISPDAVPPRRRDIHPGDSPSMQTNA